VVSAIKRLTDIMGEISAASTEQSQGVAQVGEAVTQMDQATQQNAALVEEMAAAASSLKSQAGDLVQTVAVFKLSHNDGAASASRPHAAPTQFAAAKRPSAPAVAKARIHGAAKPSALSAPKAVTAKGGASEDWESF
jgi:uncharacterized phage infection (PIP) family protein YhgE